MPGNRGNIGMRADGAARLPGDFPSVWPGRFGDRARATARWSTTPAHLSTGGRRSGGPARPPTIPPCAPADGARLGGA